MVLIVGLGNPGEQYQHTRHNVGRNCVELLSQTYNIAMSDENQLLGDLGVGCMGEIPVILLNPNTFMNDSGKSIKIVCDFYDIDPSEIVVIHDDLNLDLGQYKIKQEGGTGGHNGLKSILSELNTNQFKRLRVGIGRPVEKGPILDYVLGVPSNDELIVLNNTMSHLVNTPSVFI